MPDVDRLKAGQDFGVAVKKLLQENEVGVFGEFSMVLVSGRRGFADIWVPSDAAPGEAAILEVKATDWDKITPSRVRTNVRRQVRQLWSYANAAMAKNFPVVQLFMVFPRKPTSEALRRVVEALFMEHGALVHWLETEETTPDELLEVAEEGADTWRVLTQSGLCSLEELARWETTCVTRRRFVPL